MFESTRPILDDHTHHGQEMLGWLRDLFPLNRSLTGDGVRVTLDYLASIAGYIEQFEVPTGTPAFDWKIPEEWNLRKAFIEDEEGNRFCDTEVNNLHVIGYSTPIDKLVDREELDAHLYSLPAQPDLIPYITSYYERRWGFCISHNQRSRLKGNCFRAFIDADLTPGSMTYGQAILPGKTDREILLSTYICHPSMANNELSGPVVTTALLKWLASSERRYTYRVVYIPETIGSIFYLSKHLEHLKKHVDAGFVITCVGDDRAYSYLPSRRGNTLADRAIESVIRNESFAVNRYSFLQRGSDERQYCSPLVDLPVASLMRSKYGTYPEYHTSADNLDLISAEGLWGGFEAIRKCLMTLEVNEVYRATVPCEPQLGRRGLYPTLSTKNPAGDWRMLTNVLAYADGESDLIALCEKIAINPLDAVLPIQQLLKEELLERV